MAYWDWAAASKQGASHAVVCVHGLSRQGRDFDVLAHHLSDAVRVVCPDVAGRGESDRLAQPMDYQLATYAQDMVALLAQLRTQGVQTIDWVGTSMGGLIGMALAPQPGLGLHRLVLNDVGPAIEAQALQRIGSYLGQAPVFPSADEAIRYLWGISQSFGPHTEQQWRALSEPMLRQSDAGWVLHYDPAIAEPFRALTAESAAVAAAQGEATLWGFYDAIQIPTLLLRGADSDLLSTETARSMGQRGPRARCVEFEGVGHAPTLVVPEQVAVVRSFLLDQP
jgi:pimeloyl-ACP methyl ester carboxylesterase